MQVAGDRALLPVEEHIGADAVVVGTRQTAVSQRLPIDVQLVAELGGHGQALRIYQPRSFLHSDGDPGMVAGVKCLTLIGLSMTFLLTSTTIATVIFYILYHHYP